MKTTLTLCIFLVWAQAGFAQDNNSRIIISSGMPSRISMNVTVPKQQRAASADTTHNPLYEQGGNSGQNPMFENRIQPAHPDYNQIKNGQNIKRQPAENRYSGLRDVVKTQV
ncbi:hypothetical protein [Niabella drilacis]|uniref:Uncharacterized protein n=1 Tax=Niabella drilacis (strain DSM 25811 / CCM 8410 / CCUG 62505 / LMG 26954 / E90) TaxID=1285928 RepID=A0A1G6XYM7_NIADE|nr:hypothetical protein [Niabella drilacis]SDD83121.1 hypothetical protein SAMN04487894_11464 [Niabella drilacis]